MTRALGYVNWCIAHLQPMVVPFPCRRPSLRLSWHPPCPQDALRFTQELALLCEKHCAALQDFTGTTGMAWHTRLGRRAGAACKEGPECRRVTLPL